MTDRGRPEPEVRRLQSERDECLEDIRELEKIISRLRLLVDECANELEAEYTHRHKPTTSADSTARWRRDMELVYRARAAIALTDLAAGPIPGGLSATA